MTFYRVPAGIGYGGEVDLPEARWVFHVTDGAAYGVDEQGRFPPVKIYIDAEDIRQLTVAWPHMDDVPEEIRWKVNVYGYISPFDRVAGTVQR